MLRTRLLTTVLLLCASPVAAAQPVEPHPSPVATESAAAPASADAALVSRALDGRMADLEALYRDLHQHPELGFQEQRTARVLAGRMRALGFTVTENVGKTGIVAVARNGAGPTILVRTELDALPMEEKTGLSYASRAQALQDGKSTFVAHSCGHDLHMTWWLATAQVLMGMKDRWHGTLVFVGQPAEEILGGARAMLDDGLLTRFPRPDYALAAHAAGGMPTGLVLVKEGVVLSASDALEVVFKGRGGHGSAPSATIDPVVIGAHFVTDVQSVVSRQKEAATFGVITVGSFHAGSAGNIIPDTATLQLSLRSFTPDVRQLLVSGVERTARAAAAMAEAPEPAISRLYGTAATRNDAALLGRIRGPLQQAFGQGTVVMPASAPGFSGSEDFSELADAGVPSAYLMIGATAPEVVAAAREKGVSPPTNHSPLFAPAAAPAIRNGATALVVSVLALQDGRR